MAAMKRLFTTALLACVLSACGGSNTPVRSPAQAQALTRFPALRFAPPQPTYALVSTRTTELMSAARELMAAFGLLAGFDLAQVERMTRRELGFNPWSLDELADAGIAMEQSAVVFSAGFLPTFVLPVSDPAALERFLAERRPAKDLSVRRYRDHDWFSYRVYDDLAVQWIAWDDFLAVRFALGDDIESAAWLDGLFAGDTSPGPGELLLDAMARGASYLPEPDDARVAGMLDMRGVVEAVLGIVPGDEGSRMGSCLRVLEPFAGAIGMAAAIDWTSASGNVSVELTPAAADALRQHLLPQPAGYRSLRADAHAYASFTVDLGWLDRERAALGCPLFDRPLRLPGGIGPETYGAFTGVYGVLLDAVVSEHVIRGVAGLGVRDPATAGRLLDEIPQRRLFERDATVAGTAVKVIALPALPKVVYRLDERGLLLALGDGVMERALDSSGGTSAGAAPDTAVDVLSLGIRPARMRDLEAILVAVARALGYSSHFAHESYRRLTRYEHGSVDLALDGRTLVLQLSMGLAR